MKNEIKKDISLTSSMNFVQLKNKEMDINNKRYFNNSNKNNLYINKGNSEEIEKLNIKYESKEKEYNDLLIQYKEILESLNQKKDLLNKNKKKFKSLIINNNNMKIMLLKLMKVKLE